MSINSSVFGSKIERENFYKLSDAWGAEYRIYHNLPFLNIFSVENLFDWSKLQIVSLTDVEKGRLKKTSVDYTLCDHNDAPILCIEFDGLQQGYNVGTSYHPLYKTKRTSPELDFVHLGGESERVGQAVKKRLGNMNDIGVRR